MTINISVTVAEGLVMAADSVSQMQIGGQVLTTYATVEKLTEIGPLPIAAMVHGIGAIQGRTILSLIREFEFDQRANNPNFGTSTVTQLANDLADFVDQRYAAASWGPPPTVPTPTGNVVIPWPPVLGIVVGGFSPTQFFPELYTIRFPGRVVTQVYPPQNTPTPFVPGTGAVQWWGVEGPLKRLLMGFDIDELHNTYNTVATLQQQAAQQKSQGQTLNPAQTAAQQISLPQIDPRTALTPLQSEVMMRIPLDGMPLQDAVELADYLGSVVIGYDRFTPGPPSVGGELDLLAIQPEGVSWCRRKSFAAQMAAARR